tara:strand:+ start:79 stop:684 length:606 start_codon:yes stop_codon:yes gene_type:complete
MQEIDFFRTPFFLFKSDKNFAEKISDEIGDILKEKKKVDYISYGKIKRQDKIPVPPLSGLDFNVQTSVGGFLDNNGKDTKLENTPSKIREHIIENIKKIPIPLEIKDVWTNITSSTDYNRVHNHKEVDLVFVLYLTEGTLWIQNPNQRLKLDKVYKNIGSSISLDFNIGDMIVFPSDIHHWVEPFDGNYDRITIAGNLSIN